MKKEIIKFKLPNLAFNILTLQISNSNKIRGYHSHKAIELVRVNRGKLICQIEDTDIQVEQNQIILINSYVIHRLNVIDNANITYIQIDINKHLKQFDSNKTSYINEYLTQAFSKPYFIAQQNTQLYNLFNDMQYEVEECDKGYDIYIKSYILKLIAFMNRNDIISSPSIKMLSNIDKIMPVIKYIEENYAQKIFLDDLAKIIYCDKYNLCRQFKNLTNGTVIDFINFVRLRNAESMLSDSNKSLIEISFECGFSSVQYFNRVFKKYTGCPPTDFKKRIVK